MAWRARHRNLNPPLNVTLAPRPAQRLPSFKEKGIREFQLPRNVGGTKAN